MTSVFHLQLFGTAFTEKTSFSVPKETKIIPSWPAMYSMDNATGSQVPPSFDESFCSDAEYLWEDTRRNDFGSGQGNPKVILSS